MALSADDLIAKEAFYHASCYKYYTEVTHAFEKCYGEFDKTVDESDEAFEAVKKKLQELYDDPDIVEFPTIKNLYETLLQSSSIVGERIKHLKKNLSRKVMNNLFGFNFIENDKRLYAYPETLSVEILLESLLKIKSG